MMDTNLKRLGDAGLAVGAAEEALAEGAHQGAQDALERTDSVLAELREAWPEMSAAERKVVGGAARTVRERRDAVATRLPRRRTLTAVPAEEDPEQERDPETAMA